MTADRTVDLRRSWPLFLRIFSLMLGTVILVQLLNFGAYSYPNIGGGIMFAVAGILAILAVIEYRKPTSDRVLS